jgi:glyoxylase-like metal-dependent hydrolase (beta-lactamase superfamily II)
MRLIDLMHVGLPRVIGCYQLGDVLIDPGPESCLPTLLSRLGEQRPRVLLLTHIHLDHAGATGALLARWPDIEVYVHERGAPHLIDPERLIKSARRLYGEQMDRLWGDMAPVPDRNLRVLTGGERILDGAFEVAYTPGHASHHVSYLHEGTAFVGDVGGVRIPPSGLTIPPTPPPDIDVDAWHRSIDVVASWSPERLAITHFGLAADVEDQLVRLGRRLDEWVDRVPGQDMDAFIATLRQEIERGPHPELLPMYRQAAPPDQLYQGMERYVRKRAETVGGRAKRGSRVS